MTPDLHPDMDDLILFCLGTPSGASPSKEEAVAIDACANICSAARSAAQRRRSCVPTLHWLP